MRSSALSAPRSGLALRAVPPCGRERLQPSESGLRVHRRGRSPLPAARVSQRPILCLKGATVRRWKRNAHDLHHHRAVHRHQRQVVRGRLSLDCIHGKDEDEMLYIDPEVCIDCGACVSACPVEAIFADSDVPEKWQNYTAINADYFKKA